MELSPEAAALAYHILATQRIDPSSPDAAKVLALLQEALAALAPPKE